MRPARAAIAFCMTFAGAALPSCNAVLGIRHLDDDAAEAVTTDGEAGIAGTGYTAAVLVDHPLVYLRLDDATGIRAADSSGNGNDGAYLGSVVRPEDTVNGCGDGITGSSNTAGGWQLFMQSETLKLQRSSSDGGSDGPWLTGTLPHGAYSYVAATYDGATMRLYVNGLDVGDSPSTRALPDSPDLHLQVGGICGVPGSLDEVALYDYALPPARVRAHHQAAGSQ